jgi:maltodextrin utilization protein YvdJ
MMTTSIEIVCDNNYNVTINAPAAIFDVSHCKNTPMHLRISEAAEVLTHISSYHDIKPLTVSPEVSNLKQEIENQWQSSMGNVGTGNLILIVSSISSVVILITILVRCLPKRKRNRIWLPHWEGPMQTATV